MGTKKASDWWQEGYLWYEKKDYQKAIECYDKAIEIDPDLAPAYLFKGLMLSALGKYQKAIECFDEAIEHFDKIIKRESNYLEEYLGEEFMSYNHLVSEYQTTYYKLVELHKEILAPLYNNKGIVLEKLGKYKEAIASYECTLVIKPNDYDAAARRNIILLNMPISYKEEYKNEKLKEFDKILNYGFAIPFSNIDKDEAAGKLEQKMLNNIGKNVVAAKLRIEEAVKNSKTDYEHQIAQCTSDEFPIVFTIYYYLTKPNEIPPDTASTLLIYFARTMNVDSIKKVWSIMRAIDSKIDILFACIEFMLSLQNSFSTEIWKGKNQYELFKDYLPKFLREERRRLGDEKFVAKYYFENYLKEYRKLFE